MRHPYSCTGNGLDRWDVCYHHKGIQVIKSFNAHKILVLLDKKYPDNNFTLCQAYDEAHIQASQYKRQLIKKYIAEHKID